MDFEILQKSELMSDNLSYFLIAAKKLNKNWFSPEEHIFLLKKEIFKSLDIAHCSVFKREIITYSCLLI